MTADWIDREKQPPTEADVDATGCVLVWQIYNGAMITGIDNALRSPYITHWMRLPGAPDAQEERQCST